MEVEIEPVIISTENTTVADTPFIAEFPSEAVATDTITTPVTTSSLILDVAGESSTDPDVEISADVPIPEIDDILAAAQEAQALAQTLVLETPSMDVSTQGSVSNDTDPAVTKKAEPVSSDKKVPGTLKINPAMMIIAPKAPTRTKVHPDRKHKANSMPEINTDALPSDGPRLTHLSSHRPKRNARPPSRIHLRKKVGAMVTSSDSKAASIFDSEENFEFTLDLSHIPSAIFSTGKGKASITRPTSILDHRASELHLTNEQMLELLLSVKDGKLSVEEALERAAQQESKAVASLKSPEPVTKQAQLPAPEKKSAKVAPPPPPKHAKPQSAVTSPAPQVSRIFY